MQRNRKKNRARQRGATAIEYALLVVLVTLIYVGLDEALARAIGGALHHLFWRLDLALASIPSS